MSTRHFSNLSNRQNIVYVYSILFSLIDFFKKKNSLPIMNDETSSKLLDRDEAAQILNVSVRTIDRWIKKGSISYARKGRDLFVREDSLQKFLSSQEKKGKTQTEFPQVEAAQRKEQEKNQVITEAVQIEHSGTEPLKETSIHTPDAYQFRDLDRGFAEIKDRLLRRSPEESIYKGLYEKNEEELNVARGKLDIAHHRIGTLEAQVKSMVPLIEYRKQKEELLALAEENRFKQKDIQDLEKRVQIEQFVKKIYAGFLFIMMGILPLLIILRLWAG